MSEVKVQAVNTDSAWIVRFHFTRSHRSMQLLLTDEMIVGRKDKAAVITEDIVDLSPYGAEDEGVSRRHVRIYQEDNHLRVTDLNSGNGTWLNGDRLEANAPQELKHGDDLLLAHLAIGVEVVISPRPGSNLHKQQSLQLHDQEHEANGQTILLVINNADVLNLLSAVLMRAGYKISTSRDTLSAIRVFKQQRPAAVIVDMNLPDINGLELCRYIRRDTELHGTPVIGFDTHSGRQSAEAAIEAGGDVFIDLPINLNELRHVVSSLVVQHEKGISALQTKHLVATAPLRAVEPESRKESAVLFIAGNSEPITLNLRTPVVFGRKVAASEKNHIDLTRFNAMEYGVSRRHARIWRDENGFYVEDNGSVNGTYVNGEPAKSGSRVALKNADEIRLGKLRMYIYFLTDEDIPVP